MGQHMLPTALLRKSGPCHVHFSTVFQAAFPYFSPNVEWPAAAAGQVLFLFR